MEETSYFSEIFKIFKEIQIPLSAEEVAIKLKANGFFRRNSNLEEITPSQVRDRIRKNKSLFNIIKTKPFTYSLKNNVSNLWVLKTVDKTKQASQIESYGDSLGEFYNYDSNVANCKRIMEGDFAILIDKEKILGFAHIEKISESIGEKTIKRCPFCPSTTIDKRSRLSPTYRCNKGHVFEMPVEAKGSVTKYKAQFDKFLNIGSYSSGLMQLRPYYVNGYNQNMSMQLLDIGVFKLFPHIQSQITNDKYILSADQSYVDGDQGLFINSDEDTREISLRAIRLRRGQQEFRKKMLSRYNNACVITGCKITDILEAAHIRPHRGNNDNHPSNGLLLRADLHTLFDLYLVAIEPELLLIHFHSRVIEDYKEYHLKKLVFNAFNFPDKKSLSWHFANFKEYHF